MSGPGTWSGNKNVKNLETLRGMLWKLLVQHGEGSTSTRMAQFNVPSYRYNLGSSLNIFLPCAIKTMMPIEHMNGQFFFRDFFPPPLWIGSVGLIGRVRGVNLGSSRYFLLSLYRFLLDSLQSLGSPAPVRARPFHSVKKLAVILFNNVRGNPS